MGRGTEHCRHDLYFMILDRVREVAQRQVRQGHHLHTQREDGHEGNTFRLIKQIWGTFNGFLS